MEVLKGVVSVFLIVLMELLGVDSGWAQYGAALLSPEEVNVLKGDTAVLQCMLDPTRNAFVIWRRLDPVIEFSLGVMLDRNLDQDLKERVSVVNDRRTGEYNLHIANVRLSDTGTYECSVIFGLESARTVRSPIRLNVFEPPEDGYPLCDVHPAIPLQTGRMLTLTCKTRGGNPPSRVTWYRNREAITTALETKQHVEWWLTSDDYGVQFTCVETHRALVAPRKCSVVPLPFRLSVDLYPAVAHVDEGGKASFTCAGQGPSNSKLKFGWTINKGPIPANQDWLVSGAKGQTLSITNVTLRHNQTGIACTVTAGPRQSVKTYAMLVVYSSPDIKKTITSGREWEADRWHSATAGRTVHEPRDNPNDGTTISASSSLSKRLVIIISLGAVLFGIIVGASIAIASIYRSRKIGTTPTKPRPIKSSLKHVKKSASSRFIGRQNRGFSNHGNASPSTRLWRDSRRITFNDTQITFADPALDYDEPPPESMSTDPDDSYLGLCPDSLSSSKYEDLQTRTGPNMDYDSCYSEAQVATELEYEDVIADRNWTARSFPANRNAHTICSGMYHNHNRTSAP